MSTTDDTDEHALPPFEERLEQLRQETCAVDAAIEKKRFLVIGGTGFLGQYLVEELLARGAREVRILCRTQQEDDPERDERVGFVYGSIADADVVAEACRGIDVVFHTAANYGKPPFGRFGSGEDVISANVGGVKNVVAGCRAQNVSTLIYTSSVNVVFDGETRLDADESTPYPDPSVQDHYSRSKAAGERHVLGANGDALRTCTLRPNGIYGPRETFITGKVYRLARLMGGMPWGLSSKQRTDWTFVYNLVWAHMLAVARLEQAPDEVGGKAFFITDGEALHTMKDFIGGFLPVWGMRARSLIPVPTFLMVLGCLLGEWFFYVLSHLIHFNPPFTKAEALKAVVSHTHSTKRAEELLGYRNLISGSEGLRYMNEELRSRAK